MKLPKVNLVNSRAKTCRLYYRVPDSKSWAVAKIPQAIDVIKDLAFAERDR